jgi:glycosyltransferase involved in cell wall biosynthesis
MAPRDGTHGLRRGVNLAGYFSTESGVGEWGRAVIAAVRASGEPFAVLPYARTVLRQEADIDLPSAEGWSELDVTLVAVNADQFPFFVEDVGPERLAGQKVVGLWCWEVEGFPEWMAASAALVDEVWALSTHAADAIRPAVDKPVHAFPCPVPVDVIDRHRADGDAARDAGIELPVPAPDGFRFLFCFDYYSVFERKNPVALVEAFRRAFDGDPSVHLVVKSVNGDKHPEQAARLAAAADGAPNVVVWDGYLRPAEQRALMASCDAYASLHRSEGFGLTMAEAMALGKPVVATGYSGNLEFMTPRNSFLVPFRMAPVGAGSDPYPADAPWADPDVDAAAELLRTVAAGGDDVRARAAQAAADIRTLHSPEARVPLLQERLADVRSRPSTRHAQLPATTAPAVAAATASTDVRALAKATARKALRRGAPYARRAARAARKAVTRLEAFAREEPQG